MEHGYNQIKLCKNGTVKKEYLHRLVAQAFLTNYNKTLEVNHINHNKKDNSINNLEIVTHHENIQKAIEFYGGTFNKYGFAHKIENKSKYCVSCGKKIHYKSLRCKECSYKKQKEDKIKESKIPIKEELLEKIKSYNNISKIAREYDVSHTSVQRWCKKYDLQTKI